MANIRNETSEQTSKKFILLFKSRRRRERVLSQKDRNPVAKSSPSKSESAAVFYLRNRVTMRESARIFGITVQAVSQAYNKLKNRIREIEKTPQ